MRTNTSNNVTVAFLPSATTELTSVLFGCYALYQTLGVHLFCHFCCFVVLGYLFLRISTVLQLDRSGVVLAVSLLVSSLIEEWVILSAVDFTKLRGCLMILAMKVVSLGFDIDQHKTVLPNSLAFGSYAFCVSTAVLGPFVTFSQHQRIIAPKSLGSHGFALLHGLLAAGCALLCLTYSDCFGLWIFPDDLNKWLLAFRDAQSFRFSHYFVCLWSEATLMLSSYDGENFEPKHVARPTFIEFPRSLPEVVTWWNVPMHVWLKTYVFRTTRPRFGLYLAVLLTYAVSSLLHGCNFQLAAVLLSLGFYSLAEHGVRKKLARAYHACIDAKPCPDECPHIYKKYNPFVIFTNTCFTMLALFHLTYLGMVFAADDSLQETGYSWKHTLDKWSRFSYSSHTIAFVTFLFGKSI